MKLAFYSGGDNEENQYLDEACLSLIDNPNPTLVFIPNSSYDGEVEFQEFVEHYESYGITRFLYFPIDVPQDNVLIKEVFNSDMIHMGGGNTFYFLKYLRQYGYMNMLREYALSDKVLTGLSAGAIVMTPTIKSAGYPSFDRDENDEKIRNLKAMNLVRFEFFPHYRNSSRYDKELIEESLHMKHPLYAVPDGSGIIVEDQSISFVGKVWAFKGGVKMLVNHSL